jgi:hypothetical protein
VFLPLVPLADIRILISKDNSKTVAATVDTTIGITYPWAAILLALATVLIALTILALVSHYRLKHPGIASASLPLRIISTPSGYASLSQLQIVLWTLVVGAAAVYVMSLSGDLIQITEGTLVLLGIAGAAGVTAKLHNESQIAKAQTVATTTGQPSPPIVNPPVTQVPRWSDLIVTESMRGSVVVREIDVARFQMLLFLLITVVFVLLNVLTTYVIPEIPTGFLTLMGISNGVYLGSKVVQGT